MDVCGEIASPRESHLRVSSIGEVPRREVARCLQAVLGLCIGSAAVQRDTEPLVAETQRHVGRKVVRVRYVAVGHCRAVQVDIAHLMPVAAVQSAADVPSVQRVQPDVERRSGIRIPVAVDVFRAAYSSARCLVIGNDGSYGVARALEAGMGAEAPVALGLGNLEAQAVGDQSRPALHAEIGVKVGRERRLQPRVAHRDGERVGVIVDVEQLRNAGLTGRTAQGHLQIGLLVEAVTHVERRREVRYRAHRIDRHAQILLHVVRPLRLQRDACIHVQLVEHQPKLHVDVLSMLRALGKAAQTVAEIHLVGIVQIAEQARPLPVGTQHVGKGLVAVVREIVGRRVVLLVTVVVAIVQLQKQPLGTCLPPLAPA